MPCALQVLCKYIQISCAALSQQQERTEAALAACMATVAALAAQQQQRAGVPDPGARGPVGDGGVDQEACARGRPQGLHLRRPRWMDVRAVAAVALTASAMAAPGGSLVRRVLKMLPLLYILPPSS